MMKSIVEEKPIYFKTLEQKIFSYVCELGKEITRIMLEGYDAELAEERDKTLYRDKEVQKEIRELFNVEKIVIKT